jgi:hypothetical protein
MKVVIFTGIGGFDVNDVIAWHLILHNGWEVAEVDDYKKFSLKRRNKIFMKKEYCFSFDKSSFYLADQWELRHDPELVAAFEYWKPEDYKVIDLPNDIKEWYIDEGDCGAESIHEEHRSWH